MHTLRQNNQEETFETPVKTAGGLLSKIRDIVNYTAGTALAAKLVIGGLHLAEQDEMFEHPDLVNSGVTQMQMVEVDDEDFKANETRAETSIDFIESNYTTSVSPYENTWSSRTTSIEDTYSLSAMAA